MRVAANVSDGVIQDTASPGIQQYLEIKKRYSDTLLFYRMGDFYELFFEDARLAAAILEIALTKCGGHLY